MTDDVIFHPEDADHGDADGPHFGLGAQPSPPDPRDWPIALLYAAAATEEPLAAALPPSFRTGSMPAIPDQDSTSRCVSYSSGTLKGHQDRLDQGQFYAFDFARFAANIGTTVNGARMRDALDRMLHYGYPVIGATTPEGAHKISAYYAVPVTVAAIKAAIAAFGPVLVIAPIPHSWFHPTSAGVLPKADYLEGGHAFVLDGWDDSKAAHGAFDLVNSWGTDWGLAGRAWLPYEFITAPAGALGHPWEVWKAVDVLEFVKRTVKCGGGAYRRGPGTGYAKFGTMKAGDVTMAAAGQAVPGGGWSLTCGTAKKGSSWWKIRAINGHAVSTLYGVPFVYAATGWF